MTDPQRNHAVPVSADTFDKICGTLMLAQNMRPILLAQYGAVPECVLDYCNRARAVLNELNSRVALKKAKP